jgi:hypothetical protein
MYRLTSRHQADMYIVQRFVMVCLTVLVMSVETRRVLLWMHGFAAGDCNVSACVFGSTNTGSRYDETRYNAFHGTTNAPTGTDLAP